MSTSTTPTKIMIVRHAEKPPGPGKSFKDVTEHGEPGDGNSLIVPGWQRAGALVPFFAPSSGTPANSQIEQPQIIYAADPHKTSKRPHETMKPLAKWLNFTAEKGNFNATYKVGDETGLVQSVMQQTGVVLICWEHDHIMPDIICAINAYVPITNLAALPCAWPDVFSLVWVLDQVTGNGNGTNTYTYQWSCVNQNLLAGDEDAANQCSNCPPCDNAPCQEKAA